MKKPAFRKIAHNIDSLHKEEKIDLSEKLFLKSVLAFAHTSYDIQHLKGVTHVRRTNRG